MITVTNLRKIFTEQGVKGASKWKREDFESAIIAAEFAAYAEAAIIDAERAAQAKDAARTITGPVAPKKATATGRSRLGMVIIAKGSEIHKSQTFKAAAEAAGWTVTVTGEVYEGDTEATRYYADAYKGENAIQLAWNGRAYDYPASSALINGRNRKIRNLKEALRVLAA